jgi:hypothetical protein
MSNGRIIEQLLELGPLPREDEASVDEVRVYQELLHAIEKPVSDNDARKLVTLFGDGDLFGLAWTLLHLIESAPGWPLTDCLNDTSNEWIRLLIQSQKNVGNM